MAQTHRIQVLRPQSEDDGAGGQVPGASLVLFERLATVEPVKLSRLTEAAQVALKTGIKATLYAVAGVTLQAGDVLVFRGRSYVLQGPPQEPGFGGRHWVLTGFEA